MTTDWVGVLLSTFLLLVLVLYSLLIAFRNARDVLGGTAAGVNQTGDAIESRRDRSILSLEVHQVVEELAERRERPFAVTAGAWAGMFAGAIILLGCSYRMTAGQRGVAIIALLGVAAVEMIAGTAVLLGSGWAYRSMLALIPANLVASLALLVVMASPEFALWPAIFGMVAWEIYRRHRASRPSHGVRDRAGRSGAGGAPAPEREATRIRLTTRAA